MFIGVVGFNCGFGFCHEKNGFFIGGVGVDLGSISDGVGFGVCHSSESSSAKKLSDIEKVKK